MAQISAKDIKDYLLNQLLGYDKNVAQVKFNVTAQKKINSDGDATGLKLFQSVNPDKTPKEILDVDFPQGSGGSVEFETQNIDYSTEW